ncbi:MAG: hypothetical protein C4315_10175 [Chloroflexota bacterium]
MADLTFIGLSLGSVYALVAIGFILVYRTSGVLNFAQGGFVMVAGLLGAWMAEQVKLPVAVAAVVGIGAAFLAGGLLAVGVVIPLWRRRAPEFEIILATLLFLLGMENVSLNLLGSQPRSLPPVSEARLWLGGISLPAQYLLLFAVTLLLAYFSHQLLRRTDLGLAMRAVAENPEVSRILGIDPQRVGALAIVGTAILGGVGGVLIAPIQYAAFNLGVVYSVKGFTAAILGGFSSVGGALAGGLLLGLLEAFTARYVSSVYLDSIVLMILLLNLVVRARRLQTSELK